MARLILHARYFAPNAKKRQGRLSYLVKYYGTREGVEKPQAEEWQKNPVTEKQDELIQKLLDDIPEIRARNGRRNIIRAGRSKRSI